MSLLLGLLALIPIRSDSPESAMMPAPPHDLHDSTPEPQNQNQNEHTHESTSPRH